MSKQHTVACYYFPNYHVDPRNEAQHGPGWSEWEVVRHAPPRFEGHVQPKVPAWGHEDESDPAVMAKKIDAAADYGVDAFIFDWYYYDDGQFLEQALEKGLWNAPNNDRIKFAVLWANHDWTDIHPMKMGEEPDLLYPGKVTPETFDSMTDLLVKDYFSRSNYWLVDGAPYFSLYDLSSLIAGFGSVEDTAKALARFRDKTKAAGFPDLHLNAVVWGNTILPGEKVIDKPFELTQRLGFDSVTSYVWMHHVPMPEFPTTPFEYVRDKYFEYAEATVRNAPLPYFPNVSMGWDSSPRVCPSDVHENLEYPSMPIIGGNTPQAFRTGLERVRDFLDAHPESKGIFNINSWNEWTEGSYLEPDVVDGMAYLEAVRDVFGAGDERSLREDELREISDAACSA